MPERLDRVLVATSSDTVVLSWDARTALLEQMRHLDSLEPVRREFENAGASRPVRIPHEAKYGVIQVIDLWIKQTPGHRTALPEGIVALRDALMDE